MQIQQTWFFQHPTATVWDYLTKPELIEQWLMKTNIKPVVGYEFQFEKTLEGGCAGGSKIIYCKVLEVAPNQLLSYNWQRKNGQGEVDFTSTVKWTLSEKNGGTELNLLHDGFVLFDDFAGHSNGWNMFVYQIYDLIIKGKHANASA
jgi:uncharacterized protein YndB with AHSA1/START domain